MNEIFKLLKSEAIIVSEQLAQGVYYINHIHKNDNIYYPMFFNLSIGLERLFKLIIVTNQIINNETAKTTIKSFSHDLLKLKKQVDDIAKNYDISGLDIETPIHISIIDALSGFSEKDRYYNFDKIDKIASKDPISFFEKHVISKIKKKLVPKLKLSENECVIGKILNKHAISTTYENLKSYIKHEKEWLYIEKYLRLYILQIIKQYALILIKLSQNALAQKINTIPYYNEIFGHIIQDDTWYKTHKTYSLFNLR